jgi:pterin-4a-carbinolamine dehydratase
MCVGSQYHCSLFASSGRRLTLGTNHPNINFGWGNVTVFLQTKKIHGLHENDFIMAAKIDRIFARTAAA